MAELQTLTSADLKQVRTLRLTGLKESPAAFGQTAEEFERMSDEDLLAWIGPDSDKFVVGAFSENTTLVGLIGFARQTRQKVRHKGIVWGVYVSPEFRGQGISKKLLRQLLEQVRTIPDLLQLQLTVTSSQPAAAHLYRSFGFTEFGIEPRSLRLESGFVDEIHMYLSLGV